MSGRGRNSQSYGEDRNDIARSHDDPASRKKGAVDRHQGKPVRSFRTERIATLTPTHHDARKEESLGDVGTQTWPNRQTNNPPQLEALRRDNYVSPVSATPSSTTEGKAGRNLQLAASVKAHIGRLDPLAYSNLPPVNFGSNPISLKVVSDPESAKSSTARVAAAQLPRRPSTPREVYSDEEEPESSESDASSSSSSDGAFVCRRVINQRHRCSSSSHSNDSDDEGEWGRVTGGLNINLASASSEDDGMFIPEPVISLDNARQKPALPYHSKEELQVGRRVWVVDEEDVETLLNNNFSRSYEMVCNGKMPGTVMRHNGDMTMVTFKDPITEIVCSLTMPRACLSLKPIEPYESSSTRGNNRVFGSYYCNVGPKSNGGRSAAEKRKGNLFQQFYECVPAMRVPKDSLGDLAEAQTLFQVGSLEEALEIVNRQLAKAEDQLAAESGGHATSSCCSREKLEGFAESKGPCVACSSGTRAPVTFVVDVLVLRSRIFIFLERFLDALVDAERCVRLEPSWVRGHLTVARAHSALGHWPAATSALRTAAALLPASSEIYRISNMTRYLVGIQCRLDEAGYDVSLTLDHLYRKRLYTKNRERSKGDVLCAEETPILAVSSLFGEHPAGRCSVCFRDGAEEMELITSTRTNPMSGNSPRDYPVAASAPTSLDHVRRRLGSPSLDLHAREPCSSAANNTSTANAPSRAFFCSRSCQQRASLYTQLENKHWSTLERARQQIRAKADAMDDRWPLEMMSMTLRLFFMVVTTHRRLTTQRSHTKAASERIGLLELDRPVDLKEEIVLPSPSAPLPPLTIDIALKHLGLFPLTSDTLTVQTRDGLIALHETLVADFKEESKQVYGKELLFYLYSYVKTYFTPVQLPPSRSHPKTTGKPSYAFFLPWLVGCTDRRDPASDGSVLQRNADAVSQRATSSCCRVPDTIGRCTGMSLAEILAAEEAQEKANSSNGAGSGKKSRDGDVNCRIVISSAHSTMKPVVQCHEENDICDVHNRCELSTPVEPLGPLLEIELTHAVGSHEPLRINSMPADLLY